MGLVVSVLFLLGLQYFSFLFFVRSLVGFYSFAIFLILLGHPGLICLTPDLKYVRLLLSFFLVPLNVYVYAILRIVFLWAGQQVYFIF